MSYRLLSVDTLLSDFQEIQYQSGYNGNPFKYEAISVMTVALLDQNAVLPQGMPFILSIIILLFWKTIALAITVTATTFPHRPQLLPTADGNHFKPSHWEI